MQLTKLDVEAFALPHPLLIAPLLLLVAGGLLACDGEPSTPVLDGRSADVYAHDSGRDAGADVAGNDATGDGAVGDATSDMTTADTTLDAGSAEGPGFEPNTRFIYVDQTILPTLSTNTYDPTTRLATGGSDSCYSSIQGAVDAVVVGETIRMRGGTYNSVHVHIPSVSKRGTAWTSGNWYGLESYPGEWAVLRGDGGGNENIFEDDGLGDFNKGSVANEVKYWKFERFEMTNASSAMWFHGGPQIYRYLYIHDLSAAVGSELQGAISIGLASECVIEYCYFKDNDQQSSDNAQYGHVLLMADYRDEAASALTFDPSACTRKNTIRYNYFDGSTFGIHYKNQQRFGINTRDPTALQTNFGDFGDDVHHNIITNNSAYAITTDQDGMQVHHNIVDGTIAQHYGDIPILYNIVSYNNTILRPTGGGYGSAGAMGISSGLTEGGNTGVTTETFYDEGSVQVVHPHYFAFNNIISGAEYTYRGLPFLISRDMPANTANPRLDKDDLVIERNLIHDNSYGAYSFMIGRNYDAAYTACDAQLFTVDEFNACSDTWRGVSGVLNWDKDGPLFLGVAGSDQYRVDPAFAVDATHRVADGGKGGAHPYLPNVTLPSYLGATDPAGSLWVDGLLDDVADTAWLREQSGTPSWVE